jgi:hypothetical protein
VSLYACFSRDRSLIHVVPYLTYFIHFMLILAHGYLLVILLWSLVRIYSCFVSLDIMVCIIT